jgi:hypothetical protein
VQVRRITINDREFVLVDPTAAARMMEQIEAALVGKPAWVTIPVRETNPPKVFITAHAVCFVEVLDIPDEDPETVGAALAFNENWPELY